MLEVEVVDSTLLRVRLDRAYPELPAEFADPGLAVAAGGFRARLDAFPSAGPVTRVTYLAPVSGPGPVLKVEQLRAGVDPRDAMDYPRAGLLSPADVVITRDAATVAYARSRKEFTVSPVAWDLTYVLLTPMPISPSTGLGRVSDAMRLGLVRDVVPGEVRVPLVPHWSDRLPCLSALKAPDTRIAGGPLIAFSRNDPVARALAERIAAVAVAHSGPHTVAMSPSGLDSAISTGPANAFVLPLPRQRPVSCDEVPRWPAGSRIDPLVDLRTFVILRRGVPPLLLDGDGMIRFNPATAP